MGETSLSARKLEGKVAIITGGASGIGEATARLFAKHGPRAVVIADVQDDLGKKVAESIGSDICKYVHCDVTDEEQVKSMVDSTVQTYGQLDIMFSNAGVIRTGSGTQTILDFDLSGLDRLFAINVRGMAACVKHAARVMVERQTKGSIVLSSSKGGSHGGPAWTDYVMSKHAVVGLMRCGCKQLGEHGIRVNTVSPTAVGTPMLSQMVGKDVKEAEKMFQSLTSLKNSILTVNDVANAVLFLVSDDAAFISGHDLLVDGGYTP